MIVVHRSSTTNSVPRFARIMDEGPKTYRVVELAFDIQTGGIKERWTHRWLKDECVEATEAVLARMLDATRVSASMNERIMELEREKQETVAGILSPVADVFAWKHPASRTEAS